GHGPRVSYSVEVVNQRKPTMFIAELRNIEDVLSFVNIVPVIPIREYLCIHIADPRLVDIRDDLIPRSQLAETRGLGSVFGSLLVALVAVKQAQRNAKAKGGRILRSITVVVGLNRGVRGT